MGKGPAAVAVDARGVLKGHGMMLGKVLSCPEPCKKNARCEFF